MEEQKVFFIEDLGSGWFDFSRLPQNGYIQYNALNCGTVRKAINTAKKILNDKKANVQVLTKD